MLEADVPVDAAPETAGFVSLPLPPFSRLHSNSTTNTKMTTMEAARIFLVDTWFSVSYTHLILRTWRDYSDTSVDIIAHTGDTPHNTVTPILHYDENDGYILDLALRNNRTTEQYPDGIFHPHKEYHNIKKENIGLIEVMGQMCIRDSPERQRRCDPRCLPDERRRLPDRCCGDFRH